MPIHHKNISKRFATFPKFQQILMICNELNRAESQKKKSTHYKKHIELALELMDFLIDDYDKWHLLYREILRAREIMASYYISNSQSTTKLVNNIIKLCPESYLLMNKRK